MKIIVIDPGKTGAMGLLEYRKIIEIIDTPTIGTAYNYRLILDTLSRWKQQGATSAIIEMQQVGMPKEGADGVKRRRESTKSMQQIGLGIGMWEMGMTAAQIGFEYIKPSIWTAKVKLSKGATKDEHCALASRLYPDYSSIFYGERGGKKDGRSDVALIGEAWFRANFKEQDAA